MDLKLRISLQDPQFPLVLRFPLPPPAKLRLPLRVLYPQPDLLQVSQDLLLPMAVLGLKMGLWCVKVTKTVKASPKQAVTSHEYHQPKRASPDSAARGTPPHSRAKPASPHKPLEGAGAANMAHPEVLGVHVQLVAVQLGQLGEGVLDVVQVLDGLPEGGEHLLAVGTHLGVADDGRGAGQVPEGREEPLCPGVDDQQPAGTQGTGTLMLPNGSAAAPLSTVQTPGAGPTWPGPRLRIPPR